MQRNARPTYPSLAALIGAFAFSGYAGAAPTNGFRVLHHESVQVKSERGVGAQERMSFEAYGRRFELSVSPNERIREAIGSTAGKALPLQGSIDGIPRSWVRVTRSPSGLRGMVFDGQDMYAIEPASEAAAVTVQPLNASEGDTVVYRLSDALMPVETMKCEVVTPDSTPASPSTAADAMSQLTAELQSFQTAEANVTKQIRVGVVGDFEFVQQFTLSTPEDAIVARMNIVDGIFSTQLGVKMSLAPLTVFRTASDPFTKSNASDLLNELRSYRNGTQAQRELGLTHLMTGRDLDTSTVGIAYIGGICETEWGTSLSQSGLSTTQAALIAAHEIGHNFGAPHDGESGACSSTPTTFLMAAQLNGSDQFSACSVQQITPYVNNSRCITAYIPPDAGVEVPTAAYSAVVGTPVVASFRVHATGSDASANVTVTVTLPTTLTINSVSANGGTCTSGAGTASCTIGTLPAGDGRQVDLNLTPTATGAHALNISLDSTNDPNASNDTGVITLNASNTATAPPSTPPSDTTSSSGGGGGGRLDVTLLALLGLTLAGVMRIRRGGPSHPRAAWDARALRPLRRLHPRARTSPSSSPRA
jgi:hypothetical protein